MQREDWYMSADAGARHIHFGSSILVNVVTLKITRRTAGSCGLLYCSARLLSSFHSPPPLTARPLGTRTRQRRGYAPAWQRRARVRSASPRSRAGLWRPRCRGWGQSCPPAAPRGGLAAPIRRHRRRLAPAPAPAARRFLACTRRVSDAADKPDARRPRGRLRRQLLSVRPSLRGPTRLTYRPDGPRQTALPARAGPPMRGTLRRVRLCPLALGR